MKPDQPPSTAPAAGGCLLALGVIGGLLYGTFVGSPSLAILIGTLAGIIAATAVYLINRRA